MAEREPQESVDAVPDRRTRPHRSARGPGEARRAMTARQAAARAAAEVGRLAGRQPEGVTSLERDDEGWRIGIEVVEARRIPDSTDIMAVYQVQLDPSGDLVSYRRERRYHRGRIDEELP